MNIRKIAAIAVLVLSSFAANDVAPSKAELESMYDKAFREFDGNNFPEALKQLDAIDARQPDVAESQNLRGVIFMREGIYDKAEAALHEALRIDPKFWNARFNLAEVPFLKKEWTEARNRFQDLLSSNSSELQGEASQLIQYKILLTYLLEGKENMVDSILAKFELSPETPAVHYANAAIALQHKNSKEAKDWMAAAEKNFSPQLNKLFAESLYEVGWLQKQSGQSRAALEITTPEERQAKLKAFARSRFEQAQQAFQQRDLDTARKFVDEADGADPNQPSILTLRGEILMEQKDFDQAEAAFKKAAKIDPKFREAQYNLAQIPFKKKDYTKARDRYEALFSQTPGGDKNQASQMIKFKIFMTFLLEGKDSRAQKMMEQFQFTGDTPALYYAQAAWEFKHNNPNKANDWIVSAKKIYSSSLNGVFADSFYDLGWLQSPAAGGSPGPGTEAAAVMSAQTESSPAIEPSPIPGTTVASTKQAKSKTETLALAQPAASPVISGMEAMASHSLESPATAAAPGKVPKTDSISAGSPAMPSDIPAVAAPALSPTVETAVAAASPSASVVASAGSTEKSEVKSSPTALTDRTASATPAIKAPVIASASATPATALAPGHITEPAPSSFIDSARHFLPDSRILLIGGLVLAGLAVVAFIPDIRRRFANVQVYRAPLPVSGPRIAQGNGSRSSTPTSASTSAMKTRLTGGPRQVSLQLKASEPSLRRSVRPVGKPPRTVVPASPTISNPAETVVHHAPETEERVVEPMERVSEAQFESPRVSEPVEAVGPVIEQGAVDEAHLVDAGMVSELSAPAAEISQTVEPSPEIPAIEEWTPAAELAGSGNGQYAEVEEPIEVVSEAAPPTDSSETAEPEPVLESEFEPIGQGQPVPYQLSTSDIDSPVAEPVVSDIEEDHDERPMEIAAELPVANLEEVYRPKIEIPSYVPSLRISEPSILQPTTHVIMPEPIQIPTAPMIRTPSSAGSSQPASAMQTAVQLTFSFEIASMQLTPTFKMGALQLRPTSKIVTMRLAPSQQPQPAMNLQVTFEISKIQPAGGGLGTVRLTPSQQQRPTLGGSPSFTVGGLQLISNFEAAPVQLTPSQQASVFVTGSFQIATVEFSPSFDIASIVLNAASKQVAVQLAGAGTIEGAPMFDIANLQLGASGEIGLMQLNLLGQGPRRA
jgi:tetratricopeptide (TPR) repeat protein